MFIFLDDPSDWEKMWRISMVEQPLSSLIFTADSRENHFSTGYGSPGIMYRLTDEQAEVEPYFSNHFRGPDMVGSPRLRHGGDTATVFSFLDGHAEMIGNDLDERVAQKKVMAGFY